MVKRIMFFALLVLFTFTMNEHTYANGSAPLIQVTEEKATVYDNRTGTLVKIGELLQGEVYKAIRSYGANWYEIKFAEVTAYVPRFAVQEVTDAILINPRTNEVLSGESIKTTADATIYDNSTGSLIPFAILSKDVTYPILQVYGNWYKIEVAGRIGFVHQDGTQFIPGPIEPQPAVKGKIFELVGDQADIFDNRTGQLVKVGELLKGQPFKILRPFGDNWMEISFGDRTGYIARVKVKESGAAQVSNENKFYTPLGDMIRATADSEVYNNTTDQQSPFARISKGTAYPILSRDGDWYRIDVAGRIGYIHKNNTEMISQKVSTTNASKVPVLMYHHLLQKKENATPSNNVILNLENFREQMNYLWNNGFHTISLSDMEAYLKGTIKLKDKAVLITFDDGLKTNHLYALPILKQYGFQAGAFVITGRVTSTPSTFNPNNNQALSVPEMEEMKSHFQFGSHTAALHQLEGNKSYVVTRISEVVLNDFIISKQYLNTNYFCYPFGQYNSNTIKLLKEAGYTSAYTTKTGYATTKTNALETPRFGIYPYTSMNEFAKIVNGNM